MNASTLFKQCCIVPLLATRWQRLNEWQRLDKRVLTGTDAKPEMTSVHCDLMLAAGPLSC